jgi:hypothetical protein
MKRSLFAATALLGSCLPSFAGGTEDTVFAAWTWDKPESVISPSLADYIAPGMTDGGLVLQGLHQSYSSSRDSAGGFINITGADEKYDYSVQDRTDLSPHPDTVSFRLHWETGTSISISSLSMDVASPEKGSPLFAQASLFWTDAQNKVQWASSDVVDLPNLVSWQPLSFSFPNSSSFPIMGQELQVELYTWGGTEDGVLQVDNLQLNGTATTAVVPEPSAASLLGTLGLLGILRRRRTGTLKTSR